MATVLSGLSEGYFTTLRVLKQGAFQDVLDLIAAGGSGSSSSGAVSSAAAPLSIDAGGVLSIDLSSITAQLATKIDSLVGAGGIVVSGSGVGRTLSINLTPMS